MKYDPRAIFFYSRKIRNVIFTFYSVHDILDRSMEFILGKDYMIYMHI